MSLTAFMAQRARLVIETLYNQGISHFCVAPGSRSTPLALAIGEHPKAQVSVHFDERGLGFYALGLSKALSYQPVAILVTTGTAVANLFPALMEAHASRIPLLLLSADRPPELRDCGANQTADHIKIFSSCTRWEVDLALCDNLASDGYVISTLAYAVDRCMHSPKGPVHINCIIREPFIHLDPLEEISHSSCFYEQGHPVPMQSSFQKWGKIFSETHKGVILLGSDALTKEEIEPFLLLAEKLQWPIISDIVSGGRQIGNHPCHIQYAELVLSTLSPKADIILQIGNRFVCKALLQWMQNQTATYFLVADHPLRQDPLHKVSYRMECNTDRFCNLLLPHLVSTQTSWLSLWKDASIIVAQALQVHFEQSQTLSEPALFFFLQEKASDCSLYLSNSMPIRDADLLLYPEQGSSSIFANRGVSGIDGNIATAAGLSKGLQKPLIALLGDLATLHDLNSFSLIDKSSAPIFFLVINNQGGGIFSFLPVAKKAELFEPLIATSHNYSFEYIAKMFSLPYYKVDSWEQWQRAWEDAQAEGCSCLIEYCTERKLNVGHHSDIKEAVKKAFCATRYSLQTV
jgi:2-succinyl-5-enolpyruvyl-6-hydroxy-3-cyclohexene-1-carboxylate synthase